MKRILALILAILMMCTLFACNKKEKAQGSDASGKVSTEPRIGYGSGVTESTKVFPSDDAVLKVGVQAEPPTMFQYTNSSQNLGNTAAYPTLDTLFILDRNTREILPNVGKSYEWIDDLTMRITLREDVTSALGDNFTASDLLYSYKWGSTVPGITWFKTVDFDKSHVVSEYVADICFTKPTPFFTQALTAASSVLCVEASVEKGGGQEAMAENPVGAVGPYKLEKWERGVRLIYERRDDYWGIMPYYKKIEMHLIPDGTSRGMSLEAGDVDVIMNPSISSVLAAQDKEGLQAWISPYPTVVYFTFNSASEPFGIKECRQAVALALNYEALLQVAGSGTGTLCDSYIPNASEIHISPKEGGVNYFKHDEEAAKAKLTEAGFPDGFTFSCTYNSADVAVGKAVEIIGNNLKQVGITLEPKPMESASFSAQLSNGEYETTCILNSAQDPVRYLNMMDCRIDYKSASGGCGPAWMPAEVGDTIDKCKVTINDEEQLGYFGEFQDIVREYVPLIPLYSPSLANISSSDIIYLCLNGNAIDAKLCYPAEYLTGK